MYGCIPPSLHPFNQSPAVGITNILYGQTSSLHNTNASISYSSATMPTPWPILLAGQLFDFITIIKGFCFTSRRNRIAMYIGLVFAACQCVRIFAALISMCKAVARHGGRFRSAFAIGSTFFSCLRMMNEFNPTIESEQDSQSESRLSIIIFVMACIGAVFALVANFIMVRMVTTGLLQESSFNNTGPGFYGQWVFRGGNCAQLARTCSVYCYEWTAVGCTIPDRKMLDPNDDMVTSSASNPFQHPETIVTIAVTVIGAIWILYLIGSCSDGDFSACFDANGGPDFTNLCSLIWIIIATVISVRIHYYAQITPVQFAILDHYGEISKISTRCGVDGINGISWSDYFVTEIPTDKYGFIKEWAQYKENSLSDWLSFF